MAVIPIGRRRPKQAGPRRFVKNEPVSIAELEYHRFRTQLFELLEPVTTSRTDAEKAVISGTLREYLSRFVELQAVNVHEAKQRRQLQAELNTLRKTLLGAQSDIASLKADAVQARRLARHDPLTGLPNRTYFRERLEARLSVAKQKNQSVAVLYLDLDGFKAINDTHGHAVGDAVLCIIGARLRRTLRVEDMVSRLGGDEFACFVSGFPTRAALQHFAQKLIDIVASLERVNSIDIEARVSIGIALYPEHGDSADSLLRGADAAMYHSKRMHKGVSFSLDKSIPMLTCGDFV